LRKLRDRFVGSLLGERKGLSEAKQSGDFKHDSFISPTRDVLNLSKGNLASNYEPTHVYCVHNSLRWGWRRVNEYFRDLFGMDHQREVYELMAS
jgi:hypothetical protein